MYSWENWVEEALTKLESLKVLRSLRPIHLSNHQSGPIESNSHQVFDGPNKWDRAVVEVNISEATFKKWLHDIPSSGNGYTHRKVFVFMWIIKFILRSNMELMYGYTRFGFYAFSHLLDSCVSVLFLS